MNFMAFNICRTFSCAFRVQAIVCTVDTTRAMVKSILFVVHFNVLCTRSPTNHVNDSRYLRCYLQIVLSSMLANGSPHNMVTGALTVKEL